MTEPQTLQVAFKEWASIVRALELGEQALILRKGGISEDGGAFAVEHRRFLLFPTFVHQQESGLEPRGLELLADVKATEPAPAILRISSFAEIVDSPLVRSAEALAALRPFHLWSESVVQERFRRWKDHSVHALLVRTSTLAEPVEVPLTADHAGCRSWVQVDRAVSLEGAKPALDDSAFAALASRIRAALLCAEGQDPRP